MITPDINQMIMINYQITGKIIDLRITKYGKRIFGIPNMPRKSKGFRRYIRRRKMSKSTK